MKRKSILVLAILLMTIGFASVSTVLYLNGQTFVANNKADYDVYFSKTYENGVENASVIQDKTHIVFETELHTVGEKYVLDYEVTNASKQYDTRLQMNCTGGNEYLRVENEFDTTTILPARTIRPGTLTLTVIKGTTSEVRVSIACEIVGNAIERETVGSDTLTDENIVEVINVSTSFNYNENATVKYSVKDSNNTPTNGQYIQLQYNRPFRASKMAITNSSGSRGQQLGGSSVDFIVDISGSTDGNNFETIEENVTIPVKASDHGANTETINLNSKKNYRYYRVDYISGGVSDYLGLSGRINYSVLNLEFVK